MVARKMERVLSTHSPREWPGIRVVNHPQTQLNDALIESHRANALGHLLNHSVAEEKGEDAKILLAWPFLPLPGFPALGPHCLRGAAPLLYQGHSRRQKANCTYLSCQ